AYSGREKIAKAEGAYHGAHDYVLQSLDMDARMARNNGYKAVPYGRGIPKAVSDTVVIYPYNDIEGTAAILEENEDEVGALIMETLEPGRGWRNATFHAGTYNGHPIGVAAGLKAVQILGEHPEYYDHVNRLGRQLFSGLQDLADDRRIPAWVEYVGSIGNVYFTTKDEIHNFRDTLSANTRRWWNWLDRKSTRLNSSHVSISYAVFCLKK